MTSIKVQHSKLALGCSFWLSGRGVLCELEDMQEMLPTIWDGKCRQAHLAGLGGATSTQETCGIPTRGKDHNPDLAEVQGQGDSLSLTITGHLLH